MLPHIVDPPDGHGRVLDVLAERDGHSAVRRIGLHRPDAAVALGRSLAGTVGA